MKHAGADALDRLEPLLERLRTIPELREKSRGRFYRGSRAFLHFHVDGDDFYADVRLHGAGFERMKVTTKTEQRALVVAVRRALA